MQYFSLISRILGVPYCLAMKLRNLLYSCGIRKSYESPIPVICVGNITTGGTGKTPMTVLVTSLLGRLGRNPAILTRGYMATGGFSDEAVLLKQLTGAEVIVNPDRAAGAVEAESRGADTVVMDDGFQHLRLSRNLDIVLVDASRPFGNGACLPAGRLREPLSGLRRAGIIVITRSDQVDPDTLEKLEKTIAVLAPGIPIVTAVHRPEFVTGPEGGRLPLEFLEDRKSFLFCGLGNADSFFKTAESAGAKIAGTLKFPDHADYDPRAVSRLNNVAGETDAEVLFTTQKDAIKLDTSSLNLPLFQLAVKMEITRGEIQFEEAVKTALEIG